MYGGTEMRRLIVASLVSILTIPAIADNWIKFKAQAVEDAIKNLVAKENQIATKNEYEKQMDQTTGKISVTGIYKVCAAAGKDIRTNDGYSQCRYFINYIADKSGFGTKSANQASCANQFNGIWSKSTDGKTYECVGKDGYKLVYKKSCESEDANSKCIKQFSDLKTQGPNGREFIAAYAQQKNLKLTCYIGFETRRGITSPLGQDYIRCSAGGKSYEFEFDSLNQDPGKTSVESENKAMCELFGGKIVKHPDSSVEKFWQSCDISQELCKGKLHSLALNIGHTTMYQGYCRFSREAKSTDYANLHTMKGVDSKVFYKSGAQMRADVAKVQLEEYLRNTFLNESYIVCDPTIKKFNYGLGLDPDYVLTCTVGHQQVDFLFADLTEGSESRANTGMDAMQCIIAGGTFKGESCRGPTPDECTKLDAALRAKGSTEGAKWDGDVRACILGNAMKTYKQDVVKGYVVGAVVIVGGTLVVIGTGGVAAPVVVGGVEMLAADIAFNAAIDANHRRLSKQAASRFGSFMDDAEKCTTESCALKTLEKHYATLSRVMNDLNKDDQAVVAETMDKLIGLIKTEYVACGKNDKGQTVYATAANCAMQSSTLRAIDYIDKASEPVLIIASVIYNPGFVTTRFMKMKKISKVAKDLNVTYKDAKQLIKAGDVVQDASGVATRADDAARAAAYEEKLTDAYKKYAPKNQTFDDFKKMFANEAEFDKQIEAWSSFEPGMVDMADNPRFPQEKYVATPYSTYDPELAKQLKAVEAEYADDIAKIQAEVEESKRQFRVFEDAKKADLREEERAAKDFGATIKKADDEYTQAITKLEDELRGTTGSARTAKETELKELQSAQDAFRKEQEAYLREIEVEIAPDWSKDNPLQPLLDDYADRRWTPRESDYTPEQWSYYVKQKEKENLKQGYEVARDYEKSKLINATISDDVADAVAETRRQELIDIIADDDELFAQAQRFSDLSVTEKQTFLQKAHDKLDDATHVKGMLKVRVYEDPKSSIVANAARQYNNKPLGKDLDTDEILETIVHEQSHVVDGEAADLGMLGAQKEKERITLPDQGTQWEIWYDWTTGTATEERVKSIEGDDVYRANPTEVSSWKVGGSGKENMMQKIIEKRASKK